MKTLFADPDYTPVIIGPREIPSPEEEFERLVEQLEMSWTMLADQPESAVLSINFGNRIYAVKDHPLYTARTGAWIVSIASLPEIQFD